MRTVFGVLVLGVAAILTAGVLRAAGEPPAWAYAIPPAPPAGAPAAPAQPAAPDPDTADAARQHAEFSARQHP